MEKIWIDRYPEGIPEEIDLEQCSTLIELFEKSFTDFKDANAFINMGQQISFSQLEKQSRYFATYLQHQGFKKGDAVAIMMPNLLQYPVVMMGIIRAGLVVVNVNPQYTSRELKHQLTDSGAKAIVIVENFASTLQQVVESTQIKQVFLTQVGDMLSVPKKWIINFAVKYIKKLVPKFQLNNVCYFMNALQEGALLEYERPTVNMHDLAFLQYTGGTTGVSKGAMLTHGNIMANLEQISSFLAPVIAPGKDIVVTALPLYHIFALVANCLTFIKFGCSNLLITDPRNMQDFVKELQKVKFTAITGVNTLFNGLLNTPEFHKLDFRQLKFGLGGGMAIQRPIAERWQKLTGTVLIEGYGLTECSPVVTCNPHDIEGYTGSIGLPLPSTEIRLVDDSGHCVSIGESGEMQVKGPQVMKGYLNSPEATREVIDTEGWLSTGDIATVDELGFFKIVDRKKDMILVSGFNVFSNEIEEVVVSLEKVDEVAAIGVPNEVTGESIKLFIVKNDPSLTEQEIIQHCREYLTGYKVPKLVEFREELPKSNVGKILRKVLRDL